MSDPTRKIVFLQRGNKLWMPFNLNNYIRFKPRTAEATKRAIEGGYTIEGEGYYSGQAWRFIEDFGSIMHMSMDPVEMSVELALEQL